MIFKSCHALFYNKLHAANNVVTVSFTCVILLAKTGSLCKFRKSHFPVDQ